MFEFSTWLQQSLALAAGLLPINMALVKGSDQFGLAGKWQTLFAVLSGLTLGIGSQVAIFGVPADFRGWFLAVLFGLIIAGGSIGTYEAIKHAAIKAQE